jgi:nucleoside-diphosphate-sugar epimerase
MEMKVLVTGAFGNVGRTVVRQLLADGHRVVASELLSPANLSWAKRLAHPALETRWGDLTHPRTVAEHLADRDLGAVIHLAAIIPPTAYAHPDLARRVNVDATRLVVEAVAASASRPRLVFASSMAVFGARNPHTDPRPVTAATPPRPAELYGAHKVEAERIITSSDIDWTILRLGAVVSPELMSGLDLDMLFLEAALPSDAHLHAVDVRDVARAFASAISADCVGRILLVGGDASARLRQKEMSEAMTAAIGFPGILPPGLPGNPADDDAWFCVAWMEVDEAQQLLDFQRLTWAQTLADAGAAFGRKRHLGRLARPLARTLLARRSPYHRSAETYADPWGVLTGRWGPRVLEGRRP